MSFNNYKSDRGRGGDKRSFDRPQPQMHDATCAKCGKTCKVPFRPTGNRPIYCSDCFRAEGGANTNRSDNRGSRSFSTRQLFDAICDNCKNRCQIPFQPRPGRKVFCSHCFELMEKGAQTKPENNRVQEQLDAINIKLGKILQLLSTKVQEEIKSENLNTEVEKSVEPKELTKKITVSKKTSAKRKTTKKSE